MAPTRELAMQTHDALEELGKPFGIGSVAVYGGAPKEAQIKMLRNAMRSKGNKVTTRIVVGTPGRILDLIGEGVCELGGVDYLVLDEADRMLDQGFENAIRQIISYTKKNEERQTMMCEFSSFFSTSGPADMVYDSQRDMAGVNQTTCQHFPA